MKTINFGYPTTNLDYLLNDVISNNFFSKTFEGNSFVPNINIFENENDFDIKVSLAGFKKENLTIDVKDKLLTIAGKQENVKVDNTKFIKKGFFITDFKRSIKLSDKLDLNAIEAKFIDGVLFLKINKHVEKENAAHAIVIH